MGNKISKMKPMGIIVLFSLVYMVSYITRINYAAVISAIISEEAIRNSAASLAVTGAFITYGAGQLISGWLGDRFQPAKLVLYALLATSAINLTVPFCSSLILRTILWCINGMAQAFIWPPLVRLMAELFDLANYDNACVKIAWGSCFGTVTVYLAGPIFIRFSGWRGIFYFSAVCGVITAFIWARLCGGYKINKKEIFENKILKGENFKAEDSKIGNLKTENLKPQNFKTQKAEKPLKTEKPEKLLKDGKSKKNFYVFLAVLFITIIMQGSLMNGVTTWMPSYMAKTFNLNESISVLTGVILPVFSVICLQLAGVLHKYIRNEYTCCMLLFLVGSVCAWGMLLCSGVAALFSVLLSAVLVGSMHGINLFHTCFLPRRIAGKENAGFCSGLFNFFVYVGSALSTYVFALLSDFEKIGWSGTVAVWGIIAAAGALLSLFLKVADKNKKLKAVNNKT